MPPVELDPAVESRILTADNFQEPDRVPIWDYLDNRATLEHFAPGETDPLTVAGIKVIFHSDGYLMPIMGDLLAAAIGGLNPIEPIAGMDIAVLKEKYYGRLVLVGGLDCSQVLPLGSVQEVEEATVSILRTAGPGGGLFIGSSSEITPSTPLENALAFYRTVHERGRYPIQ